MSNRTSRLHMKKYSYILWLCSSVVAGYAVLLSIAVSAQSTVVKKGAAGGQLSSASTAAKTTTSAAATAATPAAAVKSVESKPAVATSIPEKKDASAPSTKPVIAESAPNQVPWANIDDVTGLGTLATSGTGPQRLTDNRKPPSSEQVAALREMETEVVALTTWAALIVRRWFH